MNILWIWRIWNVCLSLFLFHGHEAPLRLAFQSSKAFGTFMIRDPIWVTFSFSSRSFIDLMIFPTILYSVTIHKLWYCTQWPLLRIVRYVFGPLCCLNTSLLSQTDKHPWFYDYLEFPEIEIFDMIDAIEISSTLNLSSWSTINFIVTVLSPIPTSRFLSWAAGLPSI